MFSASAAVVCDTDKDGRQELVLGSREGAIALLGWESKEGTEGFPSMKERQTFKVRACDLQA
jgi:hypothetical protein